jgi:hypothetical protein
VFISKYINFKGILRAFKSCEKMTNVYILQGDQNKSHHHTVYVKDLGHTHALNYPYNIVFNGSGQSTAYSPVAVGTTLVTLSVVSDKAVIVVNDDNSDIDKNITANSGEDEARPSNSTYIIWRRTA